MERKNKPKSYIPLPSFELVDVNVKVRKGTAVFEMGRELDTSGRYGREQGHILQFYYEYNYFNLIYSLLTLTTSYKQKIKYIDKYGH